jgi:hypothetical protein
VGGQDKVGSESVRLALRVQRVHDTPGLESTSLQQFRDFTVPKHKSKAARELHPRLKAKNAPDKLIRVGGNDANSTCLPAKPAYGHNNNDVREAISGKAFDGSGCSSDDNRNG